MIPFLKHPVLAGGTGAPLARRGKRAGAQRRGFSTRSPQKKQKKYSQPSGVDRIGEIGAQPATYGI